MGYVRRQKLCTEGARGEIHIFATLFAFGDESLIHKSDGNPLLSHIPKGYAKAKIAHLLRSKGEHTYLLYFWYVAKGEGVQVYEILGYQMQYILS